MSLHNSPKNHLSCQSPGHDRKKKGGSSGQVRSNGRTQGGGRARGRLGTVSREEEYTAQEGTVTAVPSAGFSLRMEPEKPSVGRINVGHGTRHVLLNCVLWARDDTGRWCKGSARIVVILGWMEDRRRKRAWQGGAHGTSFH